MANRSNFWKFKDLANRPGITWAKCATSVQKAMKYLHKGTFISAAGELGSLNVYKTRSRTNPRFNCVFEVRQRTVDHKEFATLDEVEKWLEEWFPKIGDQDKLASL